MKMSFKPSKHDKWEMTSLMSEPDSLQKMKPLQWCLRVFGCDLLGDGLSSILQCLWILCEQTSFSKLDLQGQRVLEKSKLFGGY